MPSPVLTARSNLGNATRRKDPAAIEQARRDLAAAKLEDYVQRTVADAPPLTDDQLKRITAMLRPIRAGGAA